MPKSSGAQIIVARARVTVKQQGEAMKIDVGSAVKYVGSKQQILLMKD
jgi:hypothetical protein